MVTEVSPSHRAARALRTERMATETPDEAASHPRSDHQLVLDVRIDEPGAYAELYRRHHRAALAFAIAATRDADLAEDVVAEAFACVLAALHSGGGPQTDFRPYLLSTVRNLSFRMGARRRRELAIAEPPAPQVDDDPPVALSLRDPALAEAFRRLPTHWQRVLWLSAVDGWTPRELAAELDVTPSTAAARTYRARSALRTALADVAREQIAPRRSS